MESIGIPSLETSNLELSQCRSVDATSDLSTGVETQANRVGLPYLQCTNRKTKMIDYKIWEDPDAIKLMDFYNDGEATRFWLLKQHSNAHLCNASRQKAKVLAELVRLEHAAWIDRQGTPQTACLFVGGANDGQTILMPDQKNEVKMPVQESAFRWNYNEYFRERLHSFGEVISIFRHESISQNELIHRLLNGYKPQGA